MSSRAAVLLASLLPLLACSAPAETEPLLLASSTAIPSPTTSSSASSGGAGGAGWGAAGSGPSTSSAGSSGTSGAAVGTGGAGGAAGAGQGSAGGPPDGEGGGGGDGDCEPASCAPGECGPKPDGCGGDVDCDAACGDGLWMTCSPGGTCACWALPKSGAYLPAYSACHAVSADLDAFFCGAPGPDVPASCLPAGVSVYGTPAWCCSGAT